MKIALYPGSFKLPHAAHFAVVADLATKMGEVIVIISNKEREGFTSDESYNVWELYKKLLPDNVEITIASEYSPIKEALDIIKEHPGNEYYMVFGKNDGHNARSFVKDEYKNVHIYNAGNYNNMNATQFRQAIKSRNIKQIKTFLPKGISEVEFMEKIEQNLHEIKIQPQRQIIKIGDICQLNIIPGDLYPSGWDIKGEFKVIYKNAYGPKDNQQFEYGLENPQLYNGKTIYLNDDYSDRINKLLKKGQIRILNKKSLDEQLFTKEWWNNLLIKEEVDEIKIQPQKRPPQIGDIYQFLFKTKGTGDWDDICQIQGINQDSGNYKIKCSTGDSTEFREEEFLKYIRNGSIKFLKHENISSLNESQESIKKLTEEQKRIIIRFIGYVIKQLGISKVPKLSISYDNSQVKERSSFAYYSPLENLIWVYVKNRNIADILRSIAHELTHSKQNQDGRLQQDSGKTGSDIENEANSQAGILLRDFGKENKQIYEIKIHPNIRFKVGDSWLLKNSVGNIDDDAMIEIIGVNYNTNIITIQIKFGNGIVSGKEEWTIQEFVDEWGEDIKNAKKLTEIKIQSNNYKIAINKIYSINNNWLYDTDSNTWSEYKIQVIDNDNILLWNNEGLGITIISTQQFNIGLKTSNIKFIKHNLDEIKIRSNSITPRVGDVYLAKNWDRDNNSFYLKITKINDISLRNTQTVDYDLYTLDHKYYGTSADYLNELVYEIKIKNYIKQDLDLVLLKDIVENKIEEFKQGIKEIINGI